MIVNDAVAGSEAFVGREDSSPLSKIDLRNKSEEQILERYSRCKKPIDVVYRKKKKHMTFQLMSK